MSHCIQRKCPSTPPWCVGRPLPFGVLLLCAGLWACGGSDGPAPNTSFANNPGPSPAPPGPEPEPNAVMPPSPGVAPAVQPNGMGPVGAQPPGGPVAPAPGPAGPIDPMADAGADAGGQMPAEACPANMEQNPADADPCTAPLRPGEDRYCEFTYDGQTRKFYLYAPPSYNACAPAAMIMDAHGASESAEVHIGVERFSADAPLGYGSSWRLAVQGDNAIVVTPEGIGLRWSRANDPGYLNTVADMVEEVAEVDPEKVYITGISMGGMITVATGCADADRWRGMAPVAMLSNGCASISRPIPHIAFHATGDALTSYSDDQRLAEEMADLNGCDPTPATLYYGGPNTSSDPVCFKEAYGLGSPDAPDPFSIPLSACPSDRPETSCEHWTGCDEGVEVMFCTVAADNQELGGHLLYRNDTSLALGPLAWQFFKKFW